MFYVGYALYVKHKKLYFENYCNNLLYFEPQITEDLLQILNFLFVLFLYAIFQNGL